MIKIDNQGQWQTLILLLVLVYSFNSLKVKVHCQDYILLWNMSKPFMGYLYFYHQHLSQSTLIIFCFKIWKSKWTSLCPYYKSNQTNFPSAIQSTIYFYRVWVEVNRILSESRLRFGENRGGLACLDHWKIYLQAK